MIEKNNKYDKYQTKNVFNFMYEISIGIYVDTVEPRLSGLIVNGIEMVLIVENPGNRKNYIK